MEPPNMKSVLLIIGMMAFTFVVAFTVTLVMT